jgi:predicted acylesterase/phospholipase RssA
MSDPQRTGKIMIWQGIGSRGYLSTLMTEYMNTRLGIPQDSMFDYVDIMGGADTGALQAASYAKGATPLSTKQLYLDMNKRIYTSREVDIGCDATNDSLKLTMSQKSDGLLDNEIFYESPCAPDDGNSNFGDNILQTALVGVFADMKMSELQLPLIIPAYDQTNDRFSYFSNNTSPIFIGQESKIRDVVRASTASPNYLPTWDVEGITYRGGSIFDNNPIAIAERCLKTLKPRLNRLLIISYGTGLPSYGFNGTPSGDTEHALNRFETLYQTSTRGSQEVASSMYKFDMNYTVDETFIYNFQPILDSNIDLEEDTSTPAFYSYLDSVFNQHIIDNIAEINDFVARWNL